MSNTITSEERKQLLDDIERTKVQLEEVKERIQEAKSYGDLSENEEYSTAIEEQQNLARLLNEKMNLLNDSVVDQPNQNFTGMFRTGSYIAVSRDTDSGEVTRIFQLGSLNSTVTAGVLHSDSPLGRAVLNQQEGTFRVEQREGGPISYRVRHASSDEIEWHKNTYPDKKTVLDRMFDI